MQRLAILVGATLLGACGFSNELPGDASGPTIFVGFKDASSMADEKSANVMIEVKLSDPAPYEMSVKYQVAATTASPPDDFEIPTPEEIVFPPGTDKQYIEVKVKADTDGTEPDETVDLQLVQGRGAIVSATTSKHHLTILSKALPRVGFGVATSMLEEPMDAPIMVTLDEASEFTITANYTVKSNSATAGSDYILADGVVTFAPGMTAQPIVLDVLDDNLDEDNEDVQLTLDAATNAFVDTNRDRHAHTILDGIDPPPTVEFSAPSSVFAEGAGAQAIGVRLSAISGRTITVPYTINAGSSASSADITVSAGPLVIPPGNMTGVIDVTVLQDTMDEPTEISQLDMGTAMNATTTGQQTHTISITDDDLVCYGATAQNDVCFDSPPTGTVNLSGAIDTDSAQCLATQPTGWLGDQDAACFIVGGTINVTGATLVFGSRPLVLVAATSLSVNGNLDGSSHEGVAANGPGTPPNTCAGTAPGNDGNGGGGGAGGSFISIGGTGASGNATGAAGGTPAAIVQPPVKIRPGCAGQKGGNAGGVQGAAGGKPGGAIYLVSGGNMTIANNIFISVSGAGGGPSGAKSGGSGGGSGGMLQLFVAGTLTTSANTKLVANGGGGSGGGASGLGGAAGGDPVPATETVGGFGGGGSGAANDGGNGFASGMAVAGGNPGGNNEGGGGGGGGGGYILSNKNLGAADTSAGLVVP